MAKRKSPFKPGTPRDTGEYPALVREPSRSTLEKVRTIVRSAAPSETTEGIRYMVPMFKSKGPLFAFAALADHCSFFVTNPSVMDLFRAELKPFSTSKGASRFPSDKPFPSAFLRKPVKARVALNEVKKRPSF